VPPSEFEAVTRMRERIETRMREDEPPHATLSQGG
jgi:hypothetical protein